ncbi:MAG: hypothetical protein QF921_11690 [Pseudomonadales bacterium]|nr:hypothetical protein [Pseudomonadales bacterium]MDP6470750.1 hypothetical protein [Pseudomonadales bacterium]MDP6828298.1 hypothetical protein [Pseudomonadales bacterium]MDP6972152.1 hypothetical protein [Pseudomonadales bacterium]
MDFRQKPLIWLLIALSIPGCELSAPEKQAPLPASVEPAVERYIDTSLLISLLDQAADAYDQDQLTYPEAGSAVSLYNEVLAYQPDNAEALRGLERVVERYVQLALEAAERGHLARARSMLARARLVDADHAAIQPTATQIQLFTDANRSRMSLSKRGLTERDSTLSASLTEYGTAAKQGNCRATIRARNDAEGRWIYQQLNRGEGNGRIRAAFQIASPPSVEMMCFD